LDRPFPVSAELAAQVIARPWKERWLDGFNDEWLPGALEISDAGCGSSALLVVTGEQRGKVWYRGGCDDLLPCVGAQGEQLGFLAWYEQWLDYWLWPGAIVSWRRKLGRA
jgi:hypothetical protein